MGSGYPVHWLMPCSQRSGSDAGVIVIFICGKMICFALERVLCCRRTFLHMCKGSNAISLYDKSYAKLSLWE